MSTWKKVRNDFMMARPAVNYPLTHRMPLLEAIGISKSYSGVRALKNVSFELRRGEVHALIGENGAGKSTLIKVLTGAVQPDAGTLRVDGRAAEHHAPERARALGIAAVYQQPALFPDLSVAENIALALERGGARAVDDGPIPDDQVPHALSSSEF